MWPKPSMLFDRDVEWVRLTEFMSSELDSLRLGVLYGRRRQGKTELVHQLCDASSGFYALALEQHSAALALQRFADGLADWAGLPTGLQFSNWEAALETAIRLAGDRASRDGRAQLIVLDELPFLLTHSPEVPGIVQSLYEQYGPTRGGGHPPVRLILCGSALSSMSGLLSERQALYGRAQFNLCLTAFDPIDAATFWGIADPDIALRLHAVVGGVPGYRVLTADVPVPRSVGDFGRWLSATVLNPAHALFDEVDLLFSQEPGIADRGLYYGILAAVAKGESTPARISSRLARPANTMSYPLNVLRRAGFIAYDEDMLRARKPIISIADPIMRFHHTITIPRLQVFQRPGRAAEGWQEAQSMFESQILGPHFEALAREWTSSVLQRRYDLPVGWTGTTFVPCREHGVSHQLDVVSLSPGDMPRTESAKIALIGEAKYTNAPCGERHVARLEHVRTLLGQRAATARLAVFSRSGFTDELVRDRPEDVLLIALTEMYER